MSFFISTIEFSTTARHFLDVQRLIDISTAHDSSRIGLIQAKGSVEIRHQARS
jgi:hypothetical protein